VVVAGGTSEIALAIVRELQRRSPREVMLLGRDAEGLERAAGQLRAEGCPAVQSLPLEADDLEGHGELVAKTSERLGGIDLVIIAVGVLGDRDCLSGEVEQALQVLRVNFLGAGSLLVHYARQLRRSGGGSVVVLSSVAAERPRRANPVYGASKAGLDALAQGIGDALRPQGVRVLVARPGFVRTRMTRGLEPAPLATTPDAVARAVVRGLERGSHTVWAPAALRWAMVPIRLMPRAMFRRIAR
jgi:decaprenylphospho-beta-D-erythro-pentofuranosid-2-ulose 2-reductase